MFTRQFSGHGSFTGRIASIEVVDDEKVLKLCPHGQRDPWTARIFRGAVFGVGARVCVLAATAPWFLPHLATGCGEAIVTAFDPRTREYMGLRIGLLFALGECHGAGVRVST